MAAWHESMACLQGHTIAASLRRKGDQNLFLADFVRRSPTGCAARGVDPSYKPVVLPVFSVIERRIGSKGYRPD